VAAVSALRPGLLVLVVVLVAGCGGSSQTAPATTSVAAPAAQPLYGDDASAPLDFRDHGRVNANYPIRIDDVDYLSHGKRVSAFLVRPPHRAGKLPAAIYVHGSGGDRTELLVQATWLAARGAVALVLTAPSARAPATGATSALGALRKQRTLTADDVVAVRRGVDVLRSLPEVDGDRIGYVGWSQGARTGAIAAGVEPRLRANVLMSGGATPVSSYAARAPVALRRSVRTVLGQIDPLRYVARARPGSLLLQDGRQDEVVPKAALLALAHAAPPRTELRWYPAGHALSAAAYRDQLAWLAARLKLAGPPVAGAKTGP